MELIQVSNFCQE